ncbi:TonB-dependent receptor [Aurantiacibacter flavus]|uniref:TonB-dependent receptor n=1 Tax=Aurantiacibacter flavus TaxID=3145232 RepID=A0ABV0CXI0_9SPHN
MKRLLVGGTALALCLAPSIAHAQDAPETSTAAASEETEGRIVVTGSRIARTGFDNPTPTTVVTAEQISNTGLNDIGEVLMQSPQISVGLGAGNDTFQRDIGATFINLRGLGENRTLVLVDGRRRVSGSRDGAQVDVSAIPTSMIEGVDIITGGASAVYGADAVSGVVNIKLKDDMEGLTLSGRLGLSSRGDAGTYRVSASGGGQFDDGRGSARFGLTYSKSDTLRYADRSYTYGAGELDFVTNPDNTGPNDGIPDRIVINNPRTITTPYEPTFVVGGQRYFYDQGLIEQPDDITCYGSKCVGGDFGYDTRERNLRNPREAVSAIAGLQYELTSGITAFTDFEFSFAESETNGQGFFDSALTLSRDNPTLPDEVTALMDANNLSSIKVGYEGEYIYGNREHGNRRTTYTIAGGLRGELGSFDWTAFAQYGRRDQRYKRGNSRIESRFYEAVDAVRDPVSGDIVCRSEAARDAGCTPISVFDGMLTDEEKSYFEATFQRDVTNEQFLAGFQVTGTPIELPAGPLGVALGAEYRKDSLKSVDDALGSRGLLYRTDNGGGEVDASSDVSEAFVELVVPVLRDSIIGKSLQFEGAARYSHYDTVGDTWAWKLAGEWAPIDDLTFRVTRSRSVRAPTLVEFFAPETLGVLNITADPCDAAEINLNPNREANCRALGIPAGWVDPASSLALTTRLGGNPDLMEETSNSWTFGVVASPFDGLRLSADWWTIKIDDAIQTLSGNDIVDKCVDSETIDNPFCPLVTRGNFTGISDPYVISSIDLRQVNIGALEARGLDMAASYRTYLDRISADLPGRLDMRLTATYLDKLEELVDTTDLDTLLISDGEYGNPTWRGNLNLGYSLGGLRANWTVRYIGSSKINVQRSDEYYGGVTVDERFYHDLSFSYDFDSGETVQFGVNNLFDEHPPRTPSTYTGASGASLFDNVGTFFYLGFTKSF